VGCWVWRPAVFAGEGSFGWSNVRPADEESSALRLGDRVIIRYLDNNKVATYTLSEERDDPINGLLSVNSPLGRQLIGLAEEDETEFEVAGQKRRVMVVRTERQLTMH
jgi:transcription elongation GreA/GreB family factor